MPVGHHRGVPDQDGVDDFTKRSRPLAVDDANVQNPSAEALLDVIRHQRFHILRREGVEIEGAINRQFERFVVHETNITSSNAERARFGTRRRPAAAGNHCPAPAYQS